ncbi:MAG: ATPase, T2SS/T4P/T4SS family [Pseudomonadota bacterium]
MLTVEIQDPQGSASQMEVPDEVVIGKGARNEIRLDSWRVSKEHARLFRTPAGVLLEDMGAFSGVSVNGRKIDMQFGPLKATDIIEIGPYKLRLLEHPAAIASSSHGMPVAHPRSRSSATAHRTQRAAEEIRESRLAAERAQTISLQAGESANFSLIVTPEPGRRELEFKWRKQLHASLLETMDLRRHDTHGMSDEQLRVETERLIQQLLDGAGDALPAELDRHLLCRQVLDEAIGLGPLEELLADDSVTEIMVNRFDEIYVERAGRLLRHPMTFTDDRAVMGVIERIVAPLGRRIDESSPMVDARLKDGSRVNAIIPPLALKGPCLTIRKFAKRKLGVDDLVAFNAISAEMATFLELCVTARKNIIVSGGTGSGKTTLLNILSNFIPMGERVVTVEDAAELKLHHEHLISLESRPPNAEGKGGVMIRELVRNTLRMRPDRIVVGECRGAEALDMLQAMNTGHEGSLTTLHANSARDGLARLETMVLMAGMDLPLQAIREQIASAVHIVVQQTRFSCGSRKVTGISEITGMESGKIQLQELFKFVNQGYTGTGGKVQGYFTGCDLVPSFYEELRAFGNDLDLGIFKLNRTVREDGLDGDFNAGFNADVDHGFGAKS